MKDLKPAILLFAACTVLCGGIYPAVVTGIARAVFPKQAEGSFIMDRNGKAVGSALIGQPFSEQKYFWPRPSATADAAYNPLASGGANAGPTNAAYLATVRERVKALRDSGVAGPIPADLVQASASGLDPHISPEAARIQVPRVARVRRMSEAALEKLIASHIEERSLGFLGAARVNVLELNLALDAGK